VNDDLLTHSPGGYAGWRSLFWLIAGVHALSLGMIATCYHPPPPPNPGGYSLRDRLLDFDMIGTILLTIALVPLLVVSSTLPKPSFSLGLKAYSAATSLRLLRDCSLVGSPHPGPTPRLLAH